MTPDMPTPPSGTGPVGAGWIPIAGDWNGNGRDTVGLYNPTHSSFYLKNTNGGGCASDTFSYGVAGAGWMPIAGDWNGNGKDTVGLYDPTRSIFFLRNSSDTGSTNLGFGYGAAGAGWLPIAGNWSGPSNALLAAGGAVTASATTPTLSQSDLQPIVTEAIARWAAAGVDAASLAKLAQVQFVISDLPGSYLGETRLNQAFIDQNAAGYGWFVDPTPAVGRGVRIVKRRPAIGGH